MARRRVEAAAVAGVPKRQTSLVILVVLACECLRRVPAVEPEVGRDRGEGAQVARLKRK